MHHINKIYDFSRDSRILLYRASPVARLNAYGRSAEVSQGQRLAPPFPCSMTSRRRSADGPSSPSVDEEPELENRRKDSQSGDMETANRKPLCGAGDGSSRCRWPRFRLSPIAAVGIVPMTLAIGFGLENDPFETRLPAQQTRSLAEAADISLQRLMRRRVALRLEREHRLIASPFDKRATLDDELGRLRAHRLYQKIREMMTQHLGDEGYDRVCLKQTPDPSVLILADDVGISLNRFLHSVRAAFPAPNEKVAAYLGNEEQIFGSAIVTQRNVERYDAAFYFLINLLCEFPDDLETVTGAVSFDYERREEIENRVPGGRPRVLADPKK
jgi:hypothetical protein